MVRNEAVAELASAPFERFHYSRVMGSLVVVLAALHERRLVMRFEDIYVPLGAMP